MSSTIIRLNDINKYPFNIRVAAIDGSLHEINIENSKLSYVIAGAVFLRVSSICNNPIIYENSLIVEEVKENVNGEELMRKLEYEIANEVANKVDLVFMDRKLSMDLDLGLNIPKNTIGIVKDFDRSKVINIESDLPWLVIDRKEGDLTIGYFKFFNWIFMFQTNLDNINFVFNVLYRLALEPVPEALGYNYPLFLADKLVKYYRDQYAKTLDFIANKKLSKYRNFRRIVENGRKYL
ncbi:DNA double-strand break repair nuclease NurA [Acidianus sulfidivorans]|uniref:DNA double-strand break repair nuclease NurA n=1 Tax=Acidianus sulfidivorans TaxID=312539 RepID=UPI001F0E67A9|nr:DNA double-strand break repair nuclease NurA [Acidianus sulfidivorans]